jgi:hypothetical protein
LPAEALVYYLVETVWNDQDGWATGGVSVIFFPVPDYQKNIKVTASV